MRRLFEGFPHEKWVRGKGYTVHACTRPRKYTWQGLHAPHVHAGIPRKGRRLFEFLQSDSLLLLAGLNIFEKIDSTQSLLERGCATCAVYLRENIQPPPVTADTLCPRGISMECPEKLVSSISKGGKMLHFVYFVYIFF